MGSYVGDNGEVSLSHLVSNLNIDGNYGKLNGMRYPNPPIGLVASNDIGFGGPTATLPAHFAYEDGHVFTHPHTAPFYTPSAILGSFSHPHHPSLSSVTPAPVLGTNGSGHENGGHYHSRGPPKFYTDGSTDGRTMGKVGATNMQGTESANDGVIAGNGVNYSHHLHPHHLEMHTPNGGNLIHNVQPFVDNTRVHGIDGFGVNLHQQSLGWGGQAIQDMGAFKAPWFGKTRGRNGNGGMNHNSNGQRGDMNGRSRGRGRGRGNTNGNTNRIRKNGINTFDENSTDDISVETLIDLMRQVPNSEPLPDTIYRALFRLEGRSCALLLKELSRTGMHRRAAELFDWVRALDDGHPLQSLLDVYSYTAGISLCISTQDVDRALCLANEMKSRGIGRNVHTYTALMNVCIKCNRYSMALETYRLMQSDGCTPNVVTYNTLIDVHGKMGSWKEAVTVLNVMKSEGVEPVLRTYNTLLIACNMCSQPQEAIRVYHRMMEEGFQPNSTTYNALISAYGKSGQLDRVMEIFQEMMYRGCERSVITYSSLISACEKAGQWKLALELFQEMTRENCQPNTVTFNSLITALGQGGQWKKAKEVFDQMQTQGCTPDVVTYTAFISALEKGGQWISALQAFEQMRQQGCRADAIVYNAIIDALWETGVVWAQRQALVLLNSAIEEGHFVQTRIDPGMKQGDVNLHAMTAGVAMLSLYTWLVSLKNLIGEHGASAMPYQLFIVTDRGKTSKEQGNLVVKEAVNALLTKWNAPFKAMPAIHKSSSEASIVSVKTNGSGNGNGGIGGVLHASGPEVAAWLLSKDFESNLFAIFPCADIIPSAANSSQKPATILRVGALLDDANYQKEVALEDRCGEAFAAVRLFEKTHCLALQNMGYVYLQNRAQLVGKCINISESLEFPVEAGHDAVLLMDRVMSTSLSLETALLDLFAASCVVIAVKQIEGPSATLPQATLDRLQSITGLPLPALEQMEWNVCQILGNDTASISALRCLKLYYERLGAHHMDERTASTLVDKSFDLVMKALEDMAFLNCRPSVIAAAILYVDRRDRGIIPFWPTMLAKLTGYQDMSTPELSVAIKAAQRLKNTSKKVFEANNSTETVTSSSCLSVLRSKESESIQIPSHVQIADPSGHSTENSLLSYDELSLVQENEVRNGNQSGDITSSLQIHVVNDSDSSNVLGRNSSISSMSASTVSASISTATNGSSTTGLVGAFPTKAATKPNSGTFVTAQPCISNGIITLLNAPTTNNDVQAGRVLSPAKQAALIALQEGFDPASIFLSSVNDLPEPHVQGQDIQVPSPLKEIDRSSPDQISGNNPFNSSNDSGSGIERFSGDGSSSNESQENMTSMTLSENNDILNERQGLEPEE